MEDSVFKGPSSLLLPSSCASRWGHASTMNLPRPFLHVQLVLGLAKPIPVLPVVLTKPFLVIINPDIIGVKKKCSISLQWSLQKSLPSSVIKQLARTLFSDACTYLAARNLSRNVITSNRQGFTAGTCPISQCNSNSTDVKIHDCNEVLTTAAGQRLILQPVLKRKNSRALA